MLESKRLQQLEFNMRRLKGDAASPCLCLRNIDTPLPSYKISVALSDRQQGMFPPVVLVLKLTVRVVQS